MEDKRQLEVFTGTGEDSINKQISKEQLDKVKDEEVDNARLRLLEFYEQNEELRKMSWLEAYDRLDVKYKEQISESDIDRLVKGEKLTGEAIDKLQEERQTLLEEKEQDLFKSFNKALGGEMNKNMKLWQEIKRTALVALVFGIPGVVFMMAKDFADTQIEKRKIAEAIKDFVENNNQEGIVGAEKSFQNKFGKICNVTGLFSLIRASDIVNELKDNKEMLKAIISYKNSAVLNMEEEFKDLLNEQEETKPQNKEEESEEDEEDPEPVEGMRIY